MPKLTVYGLPAPKGSMRCIGQVGAKKHQLVEDDKTGNGAKWRGALLSAAEALHRRGGYPLLGPIAVDLAFTVPRPPSVPLAQREWPIVRSAGDTDKLIRAVLDQLTLGQVIGDDSQVVSIQAEKHYPDTPGSFDQLPRPGVVIRIERIT